MSSHSLHPLARQAVIATADSACCFWALGMTKYLAHDDPKLCVHWALDLILPYLREDGEHGDVVARSIQILRGVLDKPAVAELRQLEVSALDAWHHRSATRGGGPLARLVWAAMGVVEQVAPGQAAQLTNSCALPAGTESADVAEGWVWEQSATAIQMIRHAHPEVPQVTAEAFTRAVCFPERPHHCEQHNRVEWKWHGIMYEIATLRAADSFYFEFTDCTVDGTMYSGPFPSRKDVDEHMELLKHQPMSIRLIAPRQN